jgi:acetyl-CoA decarbonylase/synthase complex subunit delta
MERIRLAGLMGDDELTSPLKQDSDWGPREYRGPIWEIVTGLSLALAGNDLFMMMNTTKTMCLNKNW